MTTPRRFGLCLPIAWLLAGVALAAPDRVDYARDIQPLLQEHCYECHGPEKQKNGYRLDQRSRAFSGLVRHNINPGHSQTSRVYTRVLNGQTGMRMPPNGDLDAGEIDLIRRWIDEGAVWPDELANESPPRPLDADAVAFVERLRAGASDARTLAALRAEFERTPALLNRRGPGGATPLMFIALYGDARLLSAALAAGGDATRRNDAEVTAMHWTSDDYAKTRLLLDHGAPADAPSGIGRTPLMLAAENPRSEKVLALLLARGAKPTPQALISAARMNPAGLRRLLAAGVKPTSEAADIALRLDCRACVAALTAGGLEVPKALVNVVPIGNRGDPQDVHAALALHPDINATDPKGRAPLILSAISETITPDLFQRFVDLGADVQQRGLDGRNALDHALRLGRPETIAFFQQVGLTPSRALQTPSAYVTHNSPRAAIERALPLLQSSGAKFYTGGGCVSCHHNLQTTVSVAKARERLLPVDEKLACNARATMATDLDGMREQSLQGVFAPGGMATTTGYLLEAAHSDGQPAGLSTDALVRLLVNSQHPDGHWLSVVRPPQEGSLFTATAVGMRGILLYGDKKLAANRDAFMRARRWLERQVPRNTEDQAFQLLGLQWGGAAPLLRKRAADQLLLAQRADGGWAQLAWRESDAYATGQTLVALQAAGVPMSSPAWQRGVLFLLKTQLTDGSWHVRSRTHPSQSYFESGFPHGEDQFISAAGTNWAVQALTLLFEPHRGT